MRKTLVYLAILAVLSFGVYYFLISDHGSSYDPKEADFTIKDTASIGKIFIANSAGQSVLVERSTNGWTVNKKDRALPSMVNLILSTLPHQETLYPVTHAAYDNAIKVLSTDSKKVELYDRAGKKIKVFYVGGTSANQNGTNLLMEGAKTPYVVQVPGFTGYLGSRYTVEMTDWKDRTVFDMPYEEIKSVSVQYADKPINSFVISSDGENISVSADTNLSRHLDAQNTRRGNLYLKYFTNINCEGIMNGIPGMDSIIGHSHKQSVIDITGIKGEHQRADIYWMDINRRSKNLTVSDPNVPDDYDADRLYAVINGGKDTVMIQQYVFRKIFRKAFQFFQNDDTTSALQSTQPPRNVMMHKDH